LEITAKGGFFSFEVTASEAAHPRVHDIPPYGHQFPEPPCVRGARGLRARLKEFERRPAPTPVAGLRVSIVTPTRATS
jgi:hypothetical protein